MSLLVIDDMPEDIELLDYIINQDSDDSYTIHMASDRCEALDVYNKVLPDCIILDYQLQHDNGLSILTMLRSFNPYCPAIMVTGQGSEEIAVESMKVGAIDYLVKGKFTGRMVREKINHTINQCKKQKKIDEKRKEQESFISTLVHDIKAPLRRVKMTSLLISEEIEKQTQEDLRDLVELQEKAISQADSLIETLHAYALIDKSIELESVSLNDVLNDLNEILSAQLEADGCVLTFMDLPDINGHKPQLTQLFQNLIINGLKFNQSTVPKCSIFVSNITDDTLTVCIEDNGIGLDQKHKNAVFEPLTRLVSTQEYEGSGLGLSICKKIVNRHQGHIWCESQVGVGTKFFCEFPTLE